FADQVAAHHLNVLFVLEEFQRFLDHLERQAEELPEVAAEHGAAEVEGLEDQVVQEGQGKPGLLQGLGGGRGLRGGGVDVQGGAGGFQQHGGRAWVPAGCFNSSS